MVRSTLATETFSLQEGLETPFYYRPMVEEILGLESKTIPIEAYIDNKSVLRPFFQQGWLMTNGSE